MNIPTVVKKNSLLFAVLVSVILSVVINLAAFCVQKRELEDGVELYPSDKYSVEAVSCNIDENGRLTVTGNDPQIIIKNVNIVTDYIELRLSEPSKSEMKVQIYYKTSGGEYCEENSVIGFFGADISGIGFDIPKEKYNGLRFDIEGDVVIDSLTAKGEKSLSLDGILLTEFAFLIMIAAVEIWRRLPQKEDKLNFGELCWLLVCTGYYFIWSCTKPYNYAPDEYMRYSVSKFIFENNRLPVGGGNL